MTGPDTAESIADDLADLYWALPTLRVKSEYVGTQGFVHGWLMRVIRQCSAVLYLRDGGYAAESWPVRRSVQEHVVALKWLAAEGNKVLDTIERRQGNQASSRLAAVQAAGWSADPAPFDEVIAAGQAAQEHREHDTFLNFRNRCNTYGVPSDWSSWLIECAHSHPGWETAQPYWNEGPPHTMLTEPGPVERDDATWAAIMLWEALSLVNTMLAEPPWDTELAALRDRIMALPDDV